MLSKDIMKNITTQEEKKHPKSGRVKILGHFSSADGLVHGQGEVGRKFIEGYEKAHKEQQKKEDAWIKLLRKIGVSCAHPDDGWHNREEYYFGLCYPYFNDGIKEGSMVALGDPEKFVVVIVTKTDGLLSKRYHYKSTIH